MHDALLLGVAAEHGSPLYVYSLPALRRRIAEIRAAFDYERFTLYFATMANDTPSVLRAISAEGVGACINSLSHMELAFANGFTNARAQFTSTGLPAADMCRLIKDGVPANLDSVAQIALWTSTSGGKRVGARVNAASLLDRADGDRIGMDVADVRRAVDVAAQNGACISGVHVYVGTNYLDPREMLPVISALFDLAAQLPDVEYVNIGGGIGVDYQHSAGEFDLTTFGSEISRLARRLSAQTGRTISLIFEPGRSLVAGSGVFLTRVTDVKNLRGDMYVAVDASVAIFPRPLLHPSTPHRARLVGSSGNGGSHDVNIVGRTTFSRDILARTELVASPSVGDLLAFEDAGAYCASMMSRFLGQREPLSIMLDD